MRNYKNTTEISNVSSVILTILIVYQCKRRVEIHSSIYNITVHSTLICCMFCWKNGCTCSTLRHSKWYVLRPFCNQWYTPLILVELCLVHPYIECFPILYSFFECSRWMVKICHSHPPKKANCSWFLMVSGLSCKELL